MKKRTIEGLRQEQEATRGAGDWMRLEEEIQELLDWELSVTDSERLKEEKLK
jgi:hypothetical protein